MLALRRALINEPINEGWGDKASFPIFEITEILFTPCHPLNLAQMQVLDTLENKEILI